MVYKRVRRSPASSNLSLSASRNAPRTQAKIMFSPSPFPPSRRARNIGQTPSRPSRGPGSRLGTPVRVSGSRAVSEPMSIVEGSERADDSSSAMEVDDIVSPNRQERRRTKTVFAKSEELTVTMLSQVPVEVQQVLKNADFTSGQYTGDVDTRCSFCLIASGETCFVWKHSQTIPGIATCYIFPCPSNASELQPPFNAFVPYGLAREPGLILVSPSGEVFFWDSIVLGLTGGTPTHKSRLTLIKDEVVTYFVLSEPQTFIATTSKGRIFLLTISSADGSFRVSNHVFTLAKPQGAMAIIRSWMEPAPLYSSSYITTAAIRNSTEEGYEVWTCMDTSIVKWTVVHKGWEQLDFEEDINELLTVAFTEVFPELNLEGGMDLELLDLAFDSNDDFILLTSISAGLDEETEIDTRPRRHYLVVRLSRGVDDFKVKCVRTVPYRTISSDKANIHPRLRLLSGGLAYCVQFGDAVGIVAKDNSYSDILTLKSLRDRTFGCAVIESTEKMLFMNSEVLMEVDVNISKIATFNPETGPGNSIKSLMTQAILFGANPKNPLLFTFPPDVDEESLISGAEQLSRAVLASDVELVQQLPDLSRQIAERKDRLRFLICFINENAALGKMSQTSRQRLATDAEKLFAAGELWYGYCMGANGGNPDDVLLDSLLMYVEESSEQFHDDSLRAFFKLQTRDIGNILPYLKEDVENKLKTSNNLVDQRNVVFRGAEDVLSIIQSAWNFRDINSGVYGIISPMLDAWTSTETAVEVVLDFFNLVERRLSEVPADSESTSTNSLRSLFPQLASAVFRSFQERQDWLESAAAAEVAGIDITKRSFRERFAVLRPQILHSLLKYGFMNESFSLAEKYQDYRSLADLCHSSPPIYPPTSNIYADRIEKYIERFKEEFSDELYRWYIEHNEVRCLYSQSETHGEYIDSFFIKNPHPSLSWVHDLGKDRWVKASMTLLDQSDKTKDLNIRHVMLSIGKLSQIAGKTAADESATNNILDIFHDGLDYISVHQKIIEEVRSPLVGSKARQSLDNQIDVVVKAIAPELRKAYPSFFNEFRVFLRDLLQNHVLSVEDLVDVLTLKETPDFATALELVKNAKDLSDRSKLTGLRTIWRRIYIHDDWPEIMKTANTTDAQLADRYRSTALYKTIKITLLRTGSTDPDEGDAALEILSPEQAMILPTPDEIASRHAGHSEQQNARLEEEYEHEKTRLSELRLEELIERVKSLVVEDLEAEQ